MDGMGCIDTGVSKKIDQRLRHIFFFALAEIEAPEKAVSVFWGQLWILLGGTVRVFSTTIQVVFFVCLFFEDFSRKLRSKRKGNKLVWNCWVAFNYEFNFNPSND